MGKKERHAAIMELIQQKELETQEDLIQALLEHGISVTQATISRDIRELQLVKQHLENGVCCYRLPEQTPISDHLLRDAILRTDYAGQIAVLHCRSGTAQAICAAVDARQDHRIVGTIAGDDTIFILLRSEEQAAFFAKQYAVWMQTEEGETIC
jgi:transcriptional regulator of arginine metabolism